MAAPATHPTGQGIHPRAAPMKAAAPSMAATTLKAEMAFGEIPAEVRPRAKDLAHSVERVFSGRRELSSSTVGVCQGWRGRAS